MKPFWSDGERTIYHSDCLPVLREMEAESVDLVLTDPPYALTGGSRNGSRRVNDPSKPQGRHNLAPRGFMGKEWDGSLADPAVWEECLRVLKPGGFAFVFMTTRGDSLWRTLRDLEESGFDVSFSTMAWYYLSGFPKAHDIGKAVDRAAGAEREVVGESEHSANRCETTFHGAEYKGGWTTEAEGPRETTAPSTPLAQQWDGWKAGRQALKPAWEAIVVAQKPLSEKTYAANVVKHGTGAFNVDAARVPFEADGDSASNPMVRNARGCIPHRNTRPSAFTSPDAPIVTGSIEGRFPANLVVTGGALGPRSKYFDADAWAAEHVTFTEDSAAVYCPKAPKAEKERGLTEQMGEGQKHGSINAGDYEFTPPDGIPRTRRGTTNPSRNGHPTCKPLALMCWLLTLGLPPGGVALDPFLGSGTTLCAAKALGMRAIGIELNNTEDEPWCEVARRRVEAIEAPGEEAQLSLADVAAP
jgi:site-specific DNA-methyltransferase (adenine-specific)